MVLRNICVSLAKQILLPVSLPALKKMKMFVFEREYGVDFMPHNISSLPVLLLTGFVVQHQNARVALGSGSERREEAKAGYNRQHHE
jgi:hypothetical protein